MILNHIVNFGVYLHSYGWWFIIILLTGIIMNSIYIISEIKKNKEQNKKYTLKLFWSHSWSSIICIFLLIFTYLKGL